MKLPQKMINELAHVCRQRGGTEEVIGETIENSCELLTLSIVMFLRRKSAEYRSEMVQYPEGSPDRKVLATTVNTINRLTVELAETNE